jgi:hypothetical protein
MLLRIRTSIQSAAGLAIEVFALLASSSGAAVAVVFGKALLAVALGAIALGVFVRLTSRRRRALPVDQRAPSWVSPVVAVATMVECAALVEAVDLPVRLSQPGFEYYHWLVVGVFLILAYGAQTRLVRNVLFTREQRIAP